MIRRPSRIDATNKKKMAQGEEVLKKRATKVEEGRRSMYVWQGGGNLLGSSASTLSLVSHSGSVV